MLHRIITSKIPGALIAIAIVVFGVSFVASRTGEDPVALGTLRTDNLRVDSQVQIGASAPSSSQKFMFQDPSTTTTTMMWVEANGNGHVGTSGNNEAIPLVLRVAKGFAMGTGGTAIGRAADIDSACSKSSGTGSLTCEGILVSAHGGDSNYAIHVLGTGGGILTQAPEGLAVTAGPGIFSSTLQVTGTATFDKASGTALNVSNADWNLGHNGSIGQNSSSTLALNSSITTDVIMTSSASDQIFRMTNGASGGHNYGLDNGGTAGFFGATLTMYDNTASRIAFQVNDANGRFAVGAERSIVSPGVPSANHGTLSARGVDHAGSVTGVGAFTSVVLTYSSAFPNGSECVAAPKGHGVVGEYIEVATTTTTATFSCFASTTSIAANCDDFGYICVGN